MSLWHYYKRKERALNKDNKKMNNAKLSRRAMLGSAVVIQARLGNLKKGSGR